MTRSMKECVSACGYLAIAAALLAGCSSTTETAKPPAAITPASGTPQTGFSGLTLSQPLVVLVTAADATPVAGAIVDFSVTVGNATVTPTSATTNAAGNAQTQVTLGSGTAPVAVEATVHLTTLKATFSATVQAISSNLTCTSANTVTMTIGEVRTSVGGGGICVHATSTSEYMVNGFFASSVATAQTQVGITGFGIIAPTSASLEQAASAGSLLSSAAFGTNRSVALDGSTQLDLRMRNLERTMLTPRMAGARAAMARRPLRASAPPTVGQILQLNVGEGCDADATHQPDYRYGRVVALTNTAIIVADTANPAGGFTDAEYQSVGVTFDTLVDPLDRNAFGAPSDIDNNSRVLLFYTRAVNEQTPAGAGYIIEGFFNPRDLFPRTNSAVGFCDLSNVAEMFYLIVPDPGPNGTINGHARSKSDVLKFTIGTTAHEYQHLINAARRVYVNNADTFEEVWLNEGLSHMAEELLYYRAAGLTPRVNIDATSIRTTQKRLDAVNAYQLQNLARYASYLVNPITNSAYADNDSLATRGATWAFLRYAADRKATDDGTIWQQLVNSTTAGFANLTNVFGGPILDKFRDWEIAVYTDDAVAATTVYQQPSWSYRTVLPLIGAPAGPVSSTLVNGTETAKTLTGGGSMYALFGVANNATAAIAWNAPSTSVQISIVRTK